MKKARFTQDQIIGILKEHQAGATAADLCRRHGISDATFYTWRSKYGGMEVSEARRLKALEEENAKLKRLLAESVMDVSTLKELLAKKLVTPGLRREAATWAITERDYSQRRACRLIGIDPKTWRYASRRPAEEAARMRLRELAAERRRFGYRRLQILLDREGVAMNHKELFRLYREKGLSVRKRGGRKRATGTRSPIRTTVPGADGGGRLHARMPGAGSGYIVVRRTARPRTRSDRGTSRLAADDRQ